MTDLLVAVEKCEDKRLTTWGHKLIRNSRSIRYDVALAAYGSRERSSSIRNRIFGARLDRVTGIFVAPENGTCYVEAFLDRYHSEEQLV
jgi:hypothetical protein